jgi:hypothetical protein
MPHARHADFYAGGWGGRRRARSDAAYLSFWIAMTVIGSAPDVRV